MNIFVLSTDARESAAMLCDKHICKMAIESAQMLSTAIAERLEIDTDKSIGLYSPAYRHHPCTLWVGESIENFDWLVEHALEICYQFLLRFGHRHASEAIIKHAAIYAPLFDRIPRTEFVQCMPDFYKGQDPVDAYRRYYRTEKSRFATWKNTQPPYWWTKA